MAQKKKRKFFNPAVQALLHRNEAKTDELLESTAALLERHSGIRKGHNAYYEVQRFAETEEGYDGILKDIENKSLAAAADKTNDCEVARLRDRMMRLLLIRCLVGGSDDSTR